MTCKLIARKRRATGLALPLLSLALLLAIRPANVLAQEKFKDFKLETLEGKNVFLVDCLFDNSATFMNELRDWFAKHLPSVKTPIITPRQSWVDDPEMRAKVVANGDAAILGVGL